MAAWSHFYQNTMRRKGKPSQPFTRTPSLHIQLSLLERWAGEIDGETLLSTMQLFPGAAQTPIVISVSLLNNIFEVSIKYIPQGNPPHVGQYYEPFNKFHVLTTIGKNCHLSVIFLSILGLNSSLEGSQLSPMEQFAHSLTESGITPDSFPCNWPR